MRLVSLELSGFRGFPKKCKFDLDADAIIVVGANGNGKTSMFDGILWALSGRIFRLKDDSRLVSVYSETGQARAELCLKNPVTGGHFKITRSFDGKEKGISLVTPEGSFRGPSAEGQLIELIWPDAASATDPSEALASVITSSVYLQQDLIRHFVEPLSDQERFAVISELVGAGRVTELQATLERAKKAWSTATNQRHDELNSKREQLALVESRFSELKAHISESLPAISTDTWVAWWKNLAAIGISSVQIEQSSREAPSAIDNSIKQLDARKRSTERRLQALRILQDEIVEIANRPKIDFAGLQSKLTHLNNELEETKNLLIAEQIRLADLRRVHVSLREKDEQLKTLAALALRHLEDRCPVCAQRYDKEATRIRLQVMIEGNNIEEAPESEKLTQLLADVAAKEMEVSDSAGALRLAEHVNKENEMAQETLFSHLAELRIASDENSYNQQISNEIVVSETMINHLNELQRIGEELALHLGQASALATMRELARESEVLRQEIADRERQLLARNQTGDRAQKVIEALREASSAVVEERIREISPFLQNIYARIDPHPSFRLISFLSRIVRGKGQLSAIVSDSIVKKQSDSPAAIFSSSQVNALAVSIFLALNIGLPKPLLSTAILDDPLQTLDDINLLGLVDLLRRLKDQRQLCISTHDKRFGTLLSRKLRPRDESGRTIVIELEGWCRGGPDVAIREVNRDPVPLRLVGFR